MPTKQIVCLAFSRKYGGSCFAGIDLASQQWIRAIGNYEHGALSDNDCFLRSESGKFSLPNILDVIEIAFLAAEATTVQPENWKIAGGEWNKRRRAGIAEFELLKQRIADDPELFRGYDRCVSSQDIQSRPPACSLALIRPTLLRWHQELDYYGRKRYRGEFTVSGQTYDLPLTDDFYTAILSRKKDWELSNGLADSSTDLLLTISLGDLFAKTNCYHKLIAGVVELPLRCSGSTAHNR